MTSRLWFTLLLLAGVTATTPAAVYRWVDENGQTVYSQHPPPSGEVLRIKPPPPPALSPEDAHKRLEKQVHAIEDAAEDRELAEQKRAEEKEKAALDQANCAAARHNLVNLQRTPQRLMRSSDGKYTRLTEEERQQLIAETQQKIEQYCR